jgi:hypothetical protein
MNNKLKPALLGGLIVGVLSAIPIVNYCCCIWGLAGGALAAMLYVKASPTPVKMGEGAMLGGLAGVVGAIIYLVIGVPLAFLVVGASAYEEQLARTGVNIPFSGALLFVVGGLIGAVCLIVISVLGGLIGTAIFEKRKGNAVPPPPPNMGGPGGYPGT